CFLDALCVTRSNVPNGRRVGGTEVGGLHRGRKEVARRRGGRSFSFFFIVLFLRLGPVGEEKEERERGREKDGVWADGDVGVPRGEAARGQSAGSTKGSRTSASLAARRSCRRRRVAAAL